MKLYNFIYVFLILGLTSCVKDYPLKPSGKMPPLPVYHMFIQPDSDLVSHFSHAADITEKVSDENAGDIAVYRNGILLGAMTAQGGGNYKLPGFKLFPRDSFRVKASDGVNIFEVREKVPSKVQIIKVDTVTELVPGVGPAFNLKLKFTDSAIDDNFYRIYIKRYYYAYIFDANNKIKDSVYKAEVISIAGSELPFIQNNFNNYTSREILFSDATFNGTTLELKFYTTENLYARKKGRTEYIQVYLENMNKSLYEYYNTRNAHLWQQQSISQLPGFIQGNINGGYGVIGAFTMSRRVFGF